MDLFRKKAVDYQKSKLVGDIVIVMPTKYRYITIIFLTFVVVGIVFASSQTYKRKATVSGYLEPEQGSFKITSQRFAVIKDIYVSTGDEVKEGQKLLLLSTVEALSDGTRASAQALSKIDEQISKVSTQLELRQSSFYLQVQKIQQRIRSSEASIGLLDSELKIVKQTLKIKSDQQNTIKKLFNQGIENRAIMERHQLELLNEQQRYHRLMEQISEKKNQISLANSDLEIEEIRLRESKVELEQRLDQLALQKLQYREKETFTLTAQTGGVVGAIFYKEGSTVNATNPLLTIIPKNAMLIAKLMVSSESIGFIEKGDKVNIKYDAFPYQRYGTHKGYVSTIFDYAVAPNEKVGPINSEKIYYLVEVELESQKLSTGINSYDLVVGSTLLADIIIEENTILEWLLSPLNTFK